GAVAANSSGPRRLAYGTFRDVMIGMRFVTADGKLAKSGGKVVKNVAGYDMAKLLIGSLGSLGVITDVNFKVFPLPPCSRTFVLGFSDATKALQASHRILNSPLLPQALDLVDSAVGTLTQQAALAASPYSLVMATMGPEAVMERFQRDLAHFVGPAGPENIVAVSEDAEAALWHAVQELTPTVVRQNPEAAVVKVSVVLSGTEHFLDTARRAARDNALELALLARAGTGIVYSYLWEKTEGAAGPPAAVERACRALLQEADWVGAHAVIEWGCRKLKDKVAWWGSLKDDFPLMQRLKKQWDPQGILNPGRFYGGL
ncbi:MAG: FAD-binding oxidoreductase, partial [Acidobacteria bacterium]|nr:FAD-binding oxidoreductase [Acidobacteriota bacterium]